MIQRYAIDSRNDWHPLEDDEGGWVRFEDLERELASAMARSIGLLAGALLARRGFNEMNRARIQEVLQDVADDMERDATAFDGKPFNGRTVAEYFGNQAAGESEMARVWTAIEKIRAKQAAKPKHSPFPQVPPSDGLTLEANGRLWPPGTLNPSVSLIVKDTRRLDLLAENDFRLTTIPSRDWLVTASGKKTVAPTQPSVPPFDAWQAVPVRQGVLFLQDGSLDSLSSWVYDADAADRARASTEQAHQQALKRLEKQLLDRQRDLATYLGQAEVALTEAQAEIAKLRHENLKLLGRLEAMSTRVEQLEEQLTTTRASRTREP